MLCKSCQSLYSDSKGGQNWIVAKDQAPVAALSAEHIWNWWGAITQKANTFLEGKILLVSYKTQRITVCICPLLENDNIELMDL